MSAAIELRSGRWWKHISSTPDFVVLELIHAANDRNKMRIRLPNEWRKLDDAEMRERARRPELRLWEDENGIGWRVSAVGPGTEFPYPLMTRHLVFDSDAAFAGIVRFPGTDELGDLIDLEMRSLRDRIADFGGGRRAYRGPPVAR